MVSHIETLLQIQQEKIKQVECKSLFNKLSQYLNKYTGKIVTLAVIGLSSWYVIAVYQSMTI